MTTRADLVVDPGLAAFVESELLPGLGIAADAFWRGLASLVAELGPRNRALLDRRDALQAAIDGWYREHSDRPIDVAAEEAFLRSIGYLAAEPRGLLGRDRERRSGVQPDARAAAGRADHQRPLRPERGQRPLGQPLRRPLRHRRHRRERRRDARRRLQPRARRQGDRPRQGRARHRRAARRRAATRTRPAMRSRAARSLVRTAGGRPRAGRSGPVRRLPWRSRRAVGGAAARSRPARRDRHRPQPPHRQGRSGRASPTSSSRSAVTTIIDCEDSVSAVDAEDKTLVYRNWLGLMKGDLNADLEKDGRLITRRLAADRRYATPAGGELVLPGRALLLVRNVGHHMHTDAVKTGGGAADPRGLPRCAGHRRGRAPRPAGDGAVQEQPRRLGLYRQAEDARAGRGRPRRRPVRPHRGDPRPAGQHAEDRRSWTRSGAPRPTSPPASMPRASASSSSTPASSTAPATRSTPPWRPGR